MSRNKRLDACQHIAEVVTLLQNIEGAINELSNDMNSGTYKRNAKSNLPVLSKAVQTAAAVLQKANTLVNDEQSSSLSEAAKSVQVANRRRKRVFKDITNTTNHIAEIKTYNQKFQQVLHPPKKKQQHALKTAPLPPVSSPLVKRTRPSNDVGVATRYHESFKLNLLV